MAMLLDQVRGEDVVSSCTRAFLCLSEQNCYPTNTTLEFPSVDQPSGALLGASIN